jgi:serine/threonine protein kinase
VAISSQIGPYELLRPLGAGGMAETFIALRRGPAGFVQRVCLKRVLPAYAAEPQFVQMFLDEARLLAQLRNANITQVYDFGQAAGTYYMAIELVEGLDLEALLRALEAAGERMPVSLCCFILAQLFSALSYVHTLSADGQPMGLVHRDISPSNVLVSTHGEVKLTDFGIAKSRQRVHRTKTGHTRGKLAYMSPEQLHAHEVDARADLFAMGVVAFELLTGQHPFESTTDIGVVHNIATGTRPALADLAPGLPPSLTGLVDRLLQTERARRPASAEQALELLPHDYPPYLAKRELAALVKRHVRPEPVEDVSEPALTRSEADVEPGVSTPPQPLGPTSSRAAKRTWVWLGAALSICAAVILASAIKPSGSAPQADPVTPVPPAPPMPSPAPATLKPVLVSPPSVRAVPSLAAVADAGTPVDARRPADAAPVEASPAARPERTAKKRPGSPKGRGRSGLSVREDDF